MDDAGDVTTRSRALGERADRVARRHIDCCGADVESRVGQHLGRRFGVALAEVRKHDVPAGAHATGNGLADLARSDDDSDVTHG